MKGVGVELDATEVEIQEMELSQEVRPLRGEVNRWRGHTGGVFPGPPQGFHMVARPGTYYAWSESSGGNIRSTS